MTEKEIQSALSLEHVENCIRNFELEPVKEYVKNHEVTQLLLNTALGNKNFDAFVVLHSKIDIEDKSTYFLTTVTNSTPIGLYFLETHADYFKSQNNMTGYNNFYNASMFFGEVSQREREYSTEKFSNNYDAFSSMLLTNSLNCSCCDETTLEVLAYLMQNKLAFNITDEKVVQYLVENNYELNTDYSKNNFINIVEVLHDNKVSFKSDIQGNLLQISVYNDLNKIINTLVENGSNLENFLTRVNNKDNWLTEDEEIQVDMSDSNEEREYNIYKKFDSHNDLNTEKLKTCYIIKSHKELTQKIPNKEEVTDNKLVPTKLKI